MSTKTSHIRAALAVIVLGLLSRLLAYLAH